MKRSPLKRKTPLKRKSLKKYGGQHTFRKYSVKKDYVKALKNKAEELWKKAGKLLHGYECEIKKFFPEVNIIHTDIMQGDHCISRSNKHFFFDINNHSTVCSACNQAKCFDNKSVARAIDIIVRARNPEWYVEALEQDMSGKPNYNFSKVWWLEIQIQTLNDIIKELEHENTTQTPIS